MEIVKRSGTAQGFEVIPRRWVVERTFAWRNRNRRLAKNSEELISSASAWEVFRPIARSQIYEEQSWPVVQRQLVFAGVRLAMILNLVFQ